MTKKSKTTNTAVSTDTRTFWERNEASGGLLLNLTIKKYAVSIFRAILLFGMCFMILQPILNKISLSFMAEKDLYDTTIVVIPKHFSISNWKIAAYIINYKASLINTIWVSLLVSVIEVIMCTFVGYGFSRFNFPLKRFWFFCVILLIVIPPQTISTSLYLHFRYFKFFGATLNLKGTMLPYLMMCFTCMGLKNGLYIFMIRQYFLGFPFELEEACYVDGCGPFATFFRIMIPGAKPIITSCFLFSFVWQWTDSFYSNLFLGKLQVLGRSVGSLTDKLSVYMSRAQGGGNVSVPPAFAGAINGSTVLLVVIPLIILYLFCQRMFVESLASTGVKG